MRKYIKSKSGNLVYTIERQSFTETFRIPENYFQHATRNVWYSTTGFNMFVQYKGAFYLIDRTDAHGYITSLEFAPITAEEAAAAKMERAAQAMSEAQEHEAKTAAAALDYNTETAEAEAREARFCADYAAALAKDAAELAAEAGTSNAASIADTTSEYAEQAREYARRATETAEQNARELEEQAETAAALAAFEDSRPTAEDIRAKYDSPYLIWEDDPETETPENYAAEDAAYSLINAYADAIGERPSETDPEYVAAFAVAGEDIAGWHGVADIHDRATVSAMVEAIADRARATAADPEDLEDPAPIYQRYELEAYLGEPDDYDVDAIEAEATTYTADGARVWAAFGEDLAAIAERHELYSYAPAI